MKFNHKIIYLIIIILALALYLNRAYAYFFNFIGDHYTASPTDSGNVYQIKNGKNKIKYVALGDSLTAGVGTLSATATFPHQFAQILSENKHQTIELLNLGVPGGTTQNILNESLDQAINFQPDIVTILIGINDMHNRMGTKTYAQNLDKIISTLKTKTSAKVILLTTPHLGSPTILLPPYGQYFDHYTKKYNFVATNLAQANNAETWDLYSFNLTLDQSALYSSDKFHPSAKTYNKWAQFLYANFSK